MLPQSFPRLMGSDPQLAHCTSSAFPCTICLSCSRPQQGASTSKTTIMAKEQRPSIVYGPRAPVPLTLTFGQLLDHHAEVRPDSPAVISHVQNRTISYRQLCDRSINLAKAMADAGIGKGDRVGIISGTRIEYLEVGHSVPGHLGSLLSHPQRSSTRVRDWVLP